MNIHLRYYRLSLAASRALRELEHGRPDAAAGILWEARCRTRLLPAREESTRPSCVLHFPEKLAKRE